MPIGWTGNISNCTAGTTSQAFRDAMKLRVNYFRAMAGISTKVTFVGEFNSKAHEAAMMMSSNGQLSHNPPSSWKCYTNDGAEAAASSNLFLGVNGPSAISGYIKDLVTEITLSGIAAGSSCPRQPAWAPAISL